MLFSSVKLRDQTFVKGYGFLLKLWVKILVKI